MPQAAKRLRETNVQANQYRQHTQRMYNDRKWRRARRMYLKQNPYCVHCRPVLNKATHVDHIRPHQGDYDLFWQVENWQGLCAHHHNKKTRAEQIANEQRTGC